MTKEEQQQVVELKAHVVVLERVLAQLLTALAEGTGDGPRLARLAMFGIEAPLNPRSVGDRPALAKLEALQNIAVRLAAKEANSGNN